MSIIEGIRFLLATIFGAGGGGGAAYWWLKKRDQDHTENIDISDKFEKRLEKVEDQLEQTKEDYRQLKERENKLVFQINILIRRIELLVNKLDGYNELSDEEKEHLTSLPPFRTAEGDHEIDPDAI